MSGYVYRGTGFDVLAPLDVPATPVCGTPAGYQQHLRIGTTICAPCREANTVYKRGKHPRKPRKEWSPEKCGTLPGWNAHQRYGVPICEACRAAQALYQIDYRARKRAA